ncbi:DUF2180 family protein [Streptomyces sp. UG1]|uniref:DUF2180 family protein n=1 Tax=Streptomyces sp. UG1 TaxID=3417652 RepID=UPI003CF58DE8
MGRGTPWAAWHVCGAEVGGLQKSQQASHAPLSAHRLGGPHMTCYECAQLGRTSEAVAVCQLCGAAVCTAHVHAESMQVREPAHPGKVIHDQPARRLTCPVCRAAEESR